MRRYIGKYLQVKLYVTSSKRNKSKIESRKGRNDQDKTRFSMRDTTITALYLPFLVLFFDLYLSQPVSLSTMKTSLIEVTTRESRFVGFAQKNPSKFQELFSAVYNFVHEFAASCIIYTNKVIEKILILIFRFEYDMLVK